MDILHHNKIHKKSSGGLLLPLSVSLLFIIIILLSYVIFVLVCLFVVIQYNTILITLIVSINVIIWTIFISFIISIIIICYLTIITRKYIIKSTKRELFNTCIVGDVVKFDKYYNIKYLNIVDDYRWSLLHYSAYYNHGGFVDMLLSYGINKNMVSNQGHTPIDIAKIKNYKNIIEKLSK